MHTKSQNFSAVDINQVPLENSKKIRCGKPLFDFNLGFIQIPTPVLRTRPSKKLFDKINQAYEQLKCQGYFFAEAYVDMDEAVIVGLGREKTEQIINENHLEANAKFFFESNASFESIDASEIERDIPEVNSNQIKDATLSTLQKVQMLLSTDCPPSQEELEPAILNTFIQYLRGQKNSSEFAYIWADLQENNIEQSYLSEALKHINNDLYGSIETLTNLAEASKKLHQAKGRQKKKYTPGIQALIDRCIKEQLTHGQTIKLIRKQVKFNKKNDDVSDKTASKWINERLPKGQSLARADNIEAKGMARAAYNKLQSSILSGVFDY